MNCLCIGLVVNWINRFGRRLDVLEQKVEYLSQHVIIDIEPKSHEH